MFNSYLWSIYLKSGGNELVELFRRNLLENLTQEFTQKAKELHSYYYPEKDLLLYEEQQIEEVIRVIHAESKKANSKTFVSNSDATDEAISLAQIDIILDEWYILLSNGGKLNSQEIFSSFSDWLAYYTVLLSVLYPTLFIPWLYKYNFNLIIDIAEQFGIALPEIPAKKDYKGRFYYYGSVCKAFKKFQRSNGLNSFELCAFLYDFAPKYIGGIKSYIIEELPDPKSAYFIGATKDDMSLADDANVISPWQCNPETQAGDIVVMYNRTPVSAVCSIWRSRSIGFNDPFFYYYRCTFIGNPHHIKPVTLSALRSDDVLSKMWIVKKNMQGVNGVELKPSEYNRILDLACTDIPRLQYELVETDSNYMREKDVENLLVKPLLKKLDYEESDYVQQLYIEIGNHNHALIPDFVILPLKVQGHQTAFAVLEAKLSITNQKQLNDATAQARSYSKLLSAKHQLIASKEGVWLFTSKDDFLEVKLSATWTDLQDADKFYELYKILGNR